MVALDSAGKDVAAVKHTITTATTNPPGDAPKIELFEVSPAKNVSCGATSGGATMAWNVAPTEVAISFLVDGEGSGAAQAGFTNQMKGQNLPVNFVCDGKAHQVTLVATGSGGSSQSSIIVSTVAGTSGTTVKK